MRKTILFIAFLLVGVLTNAQTAAGFNFKALLANNGTPVTNQLISVKVSIFKGSSLKWREIHSNVHTDANGIFSIVMGEGTRDAGVASFDLVDWNNTTMKYKVEVDSGSGYTTLVNNEYFKRVPYAKLAENVGQLKKLGVGDTPGYAETVRFKRSNPSIGDDVLDLEMNAAPSSGTAQFIECNVGTNYGVFKVDHNGDITTKGELHAPSSGDADMKAYAYGFVNASGTIVGGSDNFTVNRSITGTYEITLTGVSGIDETNCFVVATPSNGAYNAAIRAYVGSNHKIYVKTMGDTGITLVDKSFQFVVFKK